MPKLTWRDFTIEPGTLAGVAGVWLTCPVDGCSWNVDRDDAEPHLTAREIRRLAKDHLAHAHGGDRVIPLVRFAEPESGLPTDLVAGCACTHPRIDHSAGHGRCYLCFACNRYQAATPTEETKTL